MSIKRTSMLNLKVPWGHIAAKTWGDIKSENHVLLVHGLMDNAGSFDRLIVQLPNNFYYVCIDLPGHGLSSCFPSGEILNYFNYLLTIRYVLDELQWSSIYYIGHSLGAHLGLLFSIIYPNKIQKLILIDGIVAKPTSNKDIISIIRHLHDTAIKEYNIKYKKLYKKVDIIYALMNLRKNCLTKEAAEALFERSVTKVDNDLYYYNRDFRTKSFVVPFFNMNQHLYLINQIKVETLILMASHTLESFNNIKEELLRELRNYNYVNVVEVVGNHDVHNNYPERISEHISKFLNNVKSKL